MSRPSHRRPQWWPENEPWPPVGPPAAFRWRRHRGMLFWRMGGLLFFILFLCFSLFSLLFWGVAAFLGFAGLPRPPLELPRPFLGVLVALVVIVVFFSLRGLRRLALPLGDLVEAAGRVAEGDYSARVNEGGPSEVRLLARAFNSMAARLQANAEQRRNLLADVTHELRTPLTVAQGNLEGMIDGVYPLDRAHLEPVLEETRLLARLIDDLRTLALAESGALDLRKETTDLGALVTEIAASFRPQAESAGIQLQVQAENDLTAVSLDPARIRQVLVNLLANALRYTPQGGVIRVDAHNQASPTRQVAVSVADSGPGIQAEALPHVFDRFYKSSDSRGSGLGLAIARDLILAHGGRITAESRPGEGTVICFTLPVS